MKIPKLLLGISPFLVLIPLVVFFLRYKYSSSALKFFGGYILLCSITGFLSFALWWMSMNNLWVLPIQTTLELPLLFLGFFFAMDKRKPSPAFFYSLIILFAVYSVLNSVYLQSLYRYNSYSQTFGSLLIIGYSIFYFTNLIREMKTDNLYAYPMFWIASSILLYYSGSLFLYGMGNTILNKSVQANKWIWVFHAFLAGVHYVLISIGFWRTKTK